MTIFAPSLQGGPHAKRIAPRRKWLDELPWDERMPDDAGARWVWTQTAFSEFASAAAFAEIGAALLAAGAPIDLVALAGDFVIDEVVHVEASARIAGAFGGGVALEVDLSKLVRPAIANDARVRAAELVVRTCCVGEALTVPLLASTRAVMGSTLVAATLEKILADEAQHAAFGGWFLDWADAWLDDETRAHLGRIAGAAVRSFAPLLATERAGAGVLPDEAYDACFLDAARRRVARPLAEHGIAIPPADLAALHDA
ncbi:MAG TPA: hypothetical protein VG755_07530 [Nannocystaceae bacterium]|nr:hypothetical protein [Nannocystaceae bacterium]